MGRADDLIATTLLQDAREAGITLAANNGKLRISGPKPPAWLLDAFARHRAALLAILTHSPTIDSDTTQERSSAERLCQCTELENWRVRRHPGAGRTVYFDPERHDGGLAWPGEP